MKLIEALKWRYATKKFDPARKVALSDIEKLKEAIQLSASSYGLQLYKVLIIEDPAIRAKLRPASWDQSQIEDASQLFVFCNYTQIDTTDINAFIELKAKEQGRKFEDLKGYGEFINKKLAAQTPEEKGNWTAKQTYIALTHLLAACAELRIDTCPIEGFEPEKYNEILGLTSRGLNAAVVAAIGYRSESDPSQHTNKVRKPLDELFEHI